jgi:hypothetical protein
MCPMLNIPEWKGGQARLGASGRFIRAIRAKIYILAPNG